MLVFADRLRAAGHSVHVPDLYEGRTFGDLATGVSHAEDVGFDTVFERGLDSAAGLPAQPVFIGFSLGVLPAQRLAQTRPGATGAVLISGCVPADTFGVGWPDTVAVQVHGMDADEVFIGDGDLDAARALVSSARHAQLFLYRGGQHLFADDSLPSMTRRRPGAWSHASSTSSHTQGDRPRFTGERRDATDSAVDRRRP